MTLLQQKAFQTFSALWKEQGFTLAAAHRFLLTGLKTHDFTYFRELSDDKCREILAILSDLPEIAKLYGDATGTCIACKAELTNPVSQERGMGPVCYGKTTQPCPFANLPVLQ